MNRERAETHLRLLAEAELRDALRDRAAFVARWPSGSTRTDATSSRPVCLRPAEVIC